MEMRDLERSPIAADLKEAMREMVKLHLFSRRTSVKRIVRSLSILLWSRVARSMGRLSQYFASDSPRTWRMLGADDVQVESHGLLSWFFHPTRDGRRAPSVEQNLIRAGCDLLLRTRRQGMSQRRAEWFTRWTSEAVRASHGKFT